LVIIGNYPAFDVPQATGARHDPIQSTNGGSAGRAS